MSTTQLNEIINTVVDFINGEMDKKTAVLSVKAQLASVEDLGEDSAAEVIKAMEDFSGNKDELQEFISQVSDMLSASKTIRDYFDSNS